MLPCTESQIQFSIACQQYLQLLNFIRYFTSYFLEYRHIISKKYLPSFFSCFFCLLCFVLPSFLHLFSVFSFLSFWLLLPFIAFSFCSFPPSTISLLPRLWMFLVRNWHTCSSRKWILRVVFKILSPAEDYWSSAVSFRGCEVSAVDSVTRELKPEHGSEYLIRSAFQRRESTVTVMFAGD